MLSGPRIQLRALEPGDLNFLARLENDPALWDAGDTRVPYSRHALELYIERASTEDFYAVRQIRLVMADGRWPDRAFGVIDLFDFSPANRRAAVGVALLPVARGQGYGREALNLLMTYAHDVLHLHQLHCAVAAPNTASLALFRGAGFVEIGVRREWLLAQGGIWQDVVELQRLL